MIAPAVSRRGAVLEKVTSLAVAGAMTASRSKQKAIAINDATRAMLEQRIHYRCE